MKLEWISFILFALASFIHLISFLLFAHFHNRSFVQKIINFSSHDVAKLKPWLLTVGYTDLFLAAGTIWGLYYVLSLQIMLAGVLTGFCALSMLGLGLVRWWFLASRRKLFILYWLPPLLGMVLLFFHIKKYI